MAASILEKQFDQRHMFFFLGLMVHHFFLEISVFHDFLKKTKIHDFPGWFQIPGFSMTVGTLHIDWFDIINDV